jgi:rhodanese-related sulfurtransferase
MARSLADFVREALASVEEVTPEEVRRLLSLPDRGGVELLDVREADEYEAGHLPGARHYPRGFLEVRADLEHAKRDPWLADRSRKLILYCGGGHRSALAARALQQMGFADVRSMAEGWTGWTKRSFPTEA